MQISLPKMTHLAHSRAFITSVKLSGEPGQRKSVGFNPQILIEMTERRSYRGHFRATGRPTFIFFFFRRAWDDLRQRRRRVIEAPGLLDSSRPTPDVCIFFSQPPHPTFPLSLCAASECKASAAPDRVASPSELAASHLLLLLLDIHTLD